MFDVFKANSKEEVVCYEEALKEEHWNKNCSFEEFQFGVSSFLHQNQEQDSDFFIIIDNTMYPLNGSYSRQDLYLLGYSQLTYKALSIYKYINIGGTFQSFFLISRSYDHFDSDNALCLHDHCALQAKNEQVHAAQTALGAEVFRE